MTGTEFINSLTAFGAAAQRGYSPTAPIPLPFERDFAAVLRESAKLSLPDWEAVRNVVDHPLYASLHSFAWRMAALAVRQNEPALIRSGLIALIVNGEDRDSRDELMAASTLYDAACRIHVAPEPLFREVMALATEPIAGPLNRFLESPEKARTIDTFGLAAKGNRRSWRYEFSAD